jgi:hypothetical protein
MKSNQRTAFRQSNDGPEDGVDRGGEARHAQQPRVARRSLGFRFDPRTEQVPCPSQFDPREHVTKSVADVVGAGGIERERGRGAEEEAGEGLAAVAAVVRGVRAVPRAVHVRAGRGEEIEEALVGRAVVGLGVEPPTDAGLVGDDHDREAGVVQSRDRRRGILDQPYAFGAAEVAGVLDDRAVPVEEDAGTAGRGRNDVTPR